MKIKSHPAPRIVADSLAGESIDLTALRGRKVLVKFHRFSGCPVARRQIDELIAQQPRLNDADIETIVVLHSSVGKVAPNFTEVPGLHIIADRDRDLYRAYGCAFAPSKLFAPASWRATFGALARGYLPQPTRFQGGVVGIPADFLIDEEGSIAEAHYGAHFGDSWTADEVLERAGG